MMDVNMNLSELLDHFILLKDQPILKASAILLVYIVGAKLSDLLIDRVLKRLASLTHLSLDDKLIEFFHAPLCWSIALLGAIHGFYSLNLGHPFDPVIPSIIKSAILTLWWIQIIRLINWFSQHWEANLAQKSNIGRDVFFLLKNVLRVAIIILGVLWGLSIWNVNLTPLFASAGIAGIAVALAAKETLANFFGGISIFADKSFNVGDYIILDTGERGEVVAIGIRSTRIKTRDDILITIPNSILANAKIINESAPIPRFRIRIPVGVAYGSDLKKVEQLLVKVAKMNSLVSKNPEPRARLRLFADSSINFELLCWVGDPRDKGLAVHQLLHAIYDEFEKENISIPFPQRDVHIHNM